MSILEKLTEGVVNRDMRKEGAALLEKWERTGLLEGLQDENQKNGMARLLENQAKELLREAASTMQGGDVEGFAAVAFPIVRRVFGGLIANELVSVQPMSLPSGLIFFLDFTFGGTLNSTEPRIGNDPGTSLYGGSVVGSQLTGGVDLGGSVGTAAGQFYNLTNGYSSPTGSVLNASINGGSNDQITILFSGTAGQQSTYRSAAAAISQVEADHVDTILGFDPDVVSGTTKFVIGSLLTNALTSSGGSEYNKADLVTIELTGTAWGGGAGYTSDGVMLRRLTTFSSSVGNAPDPDSAGLLFVCASDATADSNSTYSGANGVIAMITSSINASDLTFTIKDNFTATGASLGGVLGTTNWGLENQDDIPEINLKVDSVSVTALTKKLKAKWTPELGQDLNAYHNLDAEVELTSILSEQIALEIDREIVEDLVRQATGAVYYWSRSPGLFVNKETGAEVGASSKAPDFTGTVSEWYETLGETINDVSAQIHRKTLRGGANFIVTSPEVANILEFTAGFRANVTSDDAKGTAGTTKVGSLSKRYDVYVDPYFPRNLCLVGRKGNSFLESGYVYAPYVPLQVTPTIFGVEDFVPRKGVMTRYAKKMVRPDMYGLVVVRGLLGESGA